MCSTKEMSVPLAILIALLTIAVGPSAVGANEDTIVATFDPPTFFTCKANNPPLPPTAPPGIQPSINDTKNDECQGSSISGRYHVVHFSNRTGSLPAGKRVHQIVDVSGVVRKTVAASTGCGDHEARFALHLVEYFERFPAHDHHIWACCCEGGYYEFVKAQTAIMPVLPDSQLFPDFQAGLPFTTAVQKQVAENNIQVHSTLLWGREYEHDSCEPRSPRTFCGDAHCLAWWRELRDHFASGSSPRKLRWGRYFSNFYHGDGR